MPNTTDHEWATITETTSHTLHSCNRCGLFRLSSTNTTIYLIALSGNITQCTGLHAAADRVMSGCVATKTHDTTQHDERCVIVDPHNPWKDRFVPRQIAHEKYKAGLLAWNRGSQTYQVPAGEIPSWLEAYPQRSWPTEKG